MKIDLLRRAPRRRGNDEEGITLFYSTAPHESGMIGNSRNLTPLFRMEARNKNLNILQFVRSLSDFLYIYGAVRNPLLSAPALRRRRWDPHTAIILTSRHPTSI